MIPRLDIRFPLHRQWVYWFGEPYEPQEGEYMLNHARTGIVLALRAALPQGGRVGVVAYNCHTVTNAVVNSGCTPFFIDITDELKVNVASIPANLDAIVVTNLFGIHNDIATICERCPNAIIIVDNAHGYGLPAEGDFTVYSINQGKFPSLGEGGILVVNGSMSNIRCQIEEAYKSLPSYSFIAQLRLFVTMLIKAFAYSRYSYWLVMKQKKTIHLDVHESVIMKQMAPGVRRIYKAWLPLTDAKIEEQKRNAETISNLNYIIGDNAFMAIVRTNNPEALKRRFASMGVETETHFKHCIEWAKDFGYIPGSCPMAERLTKELLMIPTYVKI